MRSYLEFYICWKSICKKAAKKCISIVGELFTVLIITAAVFAVSNLSYIDKDSPFSSQFAAEMFIIRTLVDMSGMAVLYAYHIQVQELQMKFEVDTLQNILQMQYKNYQLSQESIEIVNQSIMI